MECRICDAAALQRSGELRRDFAFQSGSAIPMLKTKLPPASMPEPTDPSVSRKLSYHLLCFFTSAPEMMAAVVNPAERDMVILNIFFPRSLLMPGPSAFGGKRQQLRAKGSFGDVV